MLTIDDIVARSIRPRTPCRPPLPRAQPARTSIPVETDDIDHFGNRRLRNVGELIQNQVRTGLVPDGARRPRADDDQDVEAITPQTLINIRPGPRR